MNKSDSIIELTKSVLNVMKEVKGIDKTMTIGEGKSAYKGVPDQEVKKIIGEAMQKNGLVLLPISINPTLKIERWEGKDYKGDPTMKQSVFTEVQCSYLLMHESGEFIELTGYGHGVDSQDKSAGKATTYALKYTLLYSFLVPTGKIDDSDGVHSDDIETPGKTYAKLPEVKQPVKPEVKTTPIVKETLEPSSTKWDIAVKNIADKKTQIDIDAIMAKIRTTYNISKENEQLLIDRSNELRKERKRLADKQFDH